jgi:ADP-ribose pyrophosphatase YjhB (NUDIX family)
MIDEINFCHRCGNSLSRTLIEGKERPHCPACSITIFSDPKVVAAVLIEMDSRLVMIRRANEPGQGLWSFPSGYVDRGEPVETAAIREVKEETGLNVSLTGFLGVYSTQDSPVILLVYSGIATGGHLCPGHDAEEANLFNPNNLPELAFCRDREIIDTWSSRRKILSE